jgi:hypothetical protein
VRSCPRHFGRPISREREEVREEEGPKGWARVPVQGRFGGESHGRPLASTKRLDQEGEVQSPEFPFDHPECT